MVLFEDLQEILAKKIMALMTRSRARDPYDTHYLAQKKVQLRTNLMNKNSSSIG